VLEIFSAIRFSTTNPEDCEMFEDDDVTIYKVVINHEEQYSIWPADRENPPGWNDVGKSGLKADCLAYIDEVWTDMRPLSLRRQMDTSNRPAV
jgi:MbtH protein